MSVSDAQTSQTNRNARFLGSKVNPEILACRTRKVVRFAMRYLPNWILWFGYWKRSTCRLYDVDTVHIESGGNQPNNLHHGPWESIF